MKNIFKAALICLPLVLNSPAVSQVSVQINIGNPAVRPYPDGVWVPGYYYVEPQTHNRVWHGGDWRHDNGRHNGKNKGRGHNKHGNDQGNQGEDNGRGHGKEK